MSDGARSPPAFKLRFAAQREPGRSYVSLVKPRGLPATVTGKFYTREAWRESELARDDSEPGPGPGPDGDAAECERRALRRIRDMFERGPRERHAQPLTTAHEYGWWSAEAEAEAERPRRRRPEHHIRDSAWLKARLQVLAADHRPAPRATQIPH